MLPRFFKFNFKWNKFKFRFKWKLNLYIFDFCSKSNSRFCFHSNSNFISHSHSNSNSNSISNCNQVWSQDGEWGEDQRGRRRHRLLLHLVWVIINRQPDPVHSFHRIGSQLGCRHLRRHWQRKIFPVCIYCQLTARRALGVNIIQWCSIENQ